MPLPPRHHHSLHLRLKAGMHGSALACIARYGQRTAHTCVLLSTLESLLLHAQNSQGLSHRRASGVLLLALCLADVRSTILCLLPCLALPQEISALACCRSPFITSYYASLIPPGSSQLLIVMELLVGSVADVVSVSRGGGGGAWPRELWGGGCMRCECTCLLTSVTHPSRQQPAADCDGAAGWKRG